MSVSPSIDLDQLDGLDTRFRVCAIYARMWELAGLSCPTRPTRPQRRIAMKKMAERGGEYKGPVRTLKVRERITVYGDLVVVAVEDRRVQVRVVNASTPPPEPVMIPMRQHQ